MRAFVGIKNKNQQDIVVMESNQTKEDDDNDNDGQCNSRIQHVRQQLPPMPKHLTPLQADRMLDNLLLRGCHDGISSPSTSYTANSIPPTLKGRKVLIPCGRCAFWEGELSPSTINNNNSDATNDQAAKDDRETINTASSSVTGEEEVFIATNNIASAVDAADNLVSIPLSAAIEWLEQCSSASNPPPMAAASPPSSTKSTAAAAAPKKKAVPQPKTGSDSTPLSSHRSSATSSPLDNDTTNNNTATAFPLVEIQEEYTEDGRQVSGKAIDVTARLQALWKQEDQANHQRQREEEKVAFDEETVTGNDSVLLSSDASKDREAVIRQHQSDQPGNDHAKTPPKVISEEEYGQISKRLEELALLEEQEQQQTRARRKKSSGLTFQKGFLNAKKAKPKPTKESTKKVETLPTTNNARSVTSRSPSTTVARKSKVTIDLDQNTVQEIPQEGRQQPLPVRQGILNHQHQPPSSNRRMDTQSGFSGTIQERSNVAIGGGPSRSREIQGSTAPTTDNSTNAHKKKRVSRFAQERQHQQ